MKSIIIHQRSLRLVEAIPYLTRSKRSVLDFFTGAGVRKAYLVDLSKQLQSDRTSINKFDITRTVLKRVNEGGDGDLRARREIIRRVVQTEDYSTCYPDNQLIAEGLVAKLQRLVNVKDAFTRMNEERKEERNKNREKHLEEIESKKRLSKNIDCIKADLYALFSLDDPHRRGKDLEGILNRLFAAYEISVREAFTLKSDDGGITEQIDGVVEIDGEVYLVEMKWENKPLGKDKVSSHLVRVYHRGQARGIIISSSGYTDPAIEIVREALQKAPFCLCLLQEIVFLLENRLDLKEMLRTKIRGAVIDKKPLVSIVQIPIRS